MDVVQQSHRFLTRPLRNLALLAALVTVASIGQAADSGASGVEYFERRVRPLLAEQCYSCHGADKQKSALRLDSPAAIEAGGEKGRLFIAGNPQESRLIHAVSYEDEDLKMPPKNRLTRDQVKVLSDWVGMGAPMPARAGSGSEPATPAAQGFQIKDEDRRHWSFQPVQRPSVPGIRDEAWVQNPIDAFVLKALEKRGLVPNPPASKLELIRRVTYDLTGLPPTPEETKRFMLDGAANAWSRLVDRLLDSNAYGERWARHWLDLVRYAESNSYERDGAKPHAWRFRDYVIRSFNQDKPYDRFVREQLAGDELSDANAESLTATGYYRLGIWDDEPADRELAKYDALDDLVTTTGQVFLGLTLDCARCHNHKIDPISQADYYRFLSFFRNINPYQNGGVTDEAAIFATAEARLQYEKKRSDLNTRRAAARASVDEAEKDFLARHPMDHPNPESLAKAIQADGLAVLGEKGLARYRDRRESLRVLEGQEVPVDKALVVTEATGQPPDTFLLLRGNPNVHGEKVTPGFPSVLGHEPPQIPEPAPAARSCGRRLALANWIVSPSNQLTARVMVNRVWQHHFGRGLVRSPNNFGLQGERPTHPELLDWLASEFVGHGWSLKALHRLMLASNAYRMSSRGRPEALAADPENQLLWRFNMRRLTGEEIRDSILSVTGQLNPKSYGPSIYVDIPKAVLATQSVPGNGWGKSPAEEQVRRSLYIHAKRSLIVPILDSFDLAEMDRTTPVRFVSVQPTQALGMLNGEFINQQARELADRLRREHPDQEEDQLKRGFELVTCRAATDAELASERALLRRLRHQAGTQARSALDNLCLMLLNLNEFIYLD